MSHVPRHHRDNTPMRAESARLLAATLKIDGLFIGV